MVENKTHNFARVFVITAETNSQTRQKFNKEVLKITEP